MLYSIGNVGADLLSRKFSFRRAAVDWTAKSRSASRGELEHAAQVADFTAAFELACRSRGHLRVIHFDEILKAAPPHTRESPRPYHWPVRVRWQGKEVVIYAIPDKTLGVMDTNREPGRIKKFFFCEIDTGSMPVVRSQINMTQSSVLRKLLAYGATYRDDQHKHVYALPNFRVLFITTAHKRIESIIGAYREHAVAIAASPRLFLFADLG